MLANNAAMPATVEQTPQDEELTIGQETFNELKARREIIDSSPLYDVLLPVIQPIMQAAQAHRILGIYVALQLRRLRMIGVGRWRSVCSAWSRGSSHCCRRRPHWPPSWA